MFEGKEIKQVEQIKYFGLMIRLRMAIVLEIKKKIAMAKEKTRRLG